MRLEVAQGRPTIADLSFRWPQESRDDVEGRRLACTVRANQADNFALIDDEIHVRDRNKAAEVNGNMLDRQRWLLLCRLRVHYRASCILASAVGATFGSSFTPNHFSIAGTMPCGRTNTIRIMNRP